MEFTQEQARGLAEISVETVRHWRKAIPYLSMKSGKAARFSFSDVVGLAVMREVVESFGVQIATLSATANEMFSILNEVTAERLERAAVAFVGGEFRLIDTELQAWRPSAQAAIIVPLTPIVSTLQARILPFAEFSRQQALRFPPESVRRQA